MIVECNFAKLLDLLNSDKVFSLEAARIIEDISLIRVFFFLLIVHHYDVIVLP